jgi:hypothetical protein
VAAIFHACKAMKNIILSAWHFISPYEQKLHEIEKLLKNSFSSGSKGLSKKSPLMQKISDKYIRIAVNFTQK